MPGIWLIELIQETIVLLLAGFSKDIFKIIFLKNSNKLKFFGSCPWKE